MADLKKQDPSNPEDTEGLSGDDAADVVAYLGYWCIRVVGAPVKVAVAGTVRVYRVASAPHDVCPEPTSNGDGLGVCDEWLVVLGYGPPAHYPTDWYRRALAAHGEGGGGQVCLQYYLGVAPLIHLRQGLRRDRAGRQHTVRRAQRQRK